MDKELISFVIPCYNSTNTISRVVTEIVDTMSTLMVKYDYEIILVNDGSPDEATFGAISAEAYKNHRVKAINLARNFGQPSAVMAAIKLSKGDYVVCGDDDGQTPFHELPNLFAKIEEGYDVVEAKYDVREKRSLFRKFGTVANESMATWLINKPKGLELTTYWVIRRYVADQMLQYPGPYPYLGGLMLRTTQNACNVGVTHKERLTGKSGYNLIKMISLWLNGFTSFSVKPLRVMTIIGMLLSAGAIIYGIVIVILKIIDSSVPAGYSSLMAVILFLFGILFFFMGLVGEYVGRIYMSMNRAPQFVIKEIIEFEDIPVDEQSEE